MFWKTFLLSWWSVCTWTLGAWAWAGWSRCGWRPRRARSFRSRSPSPRCPPALTRCCGSEPCPDLRATASPGNEVMVSKHVHHVNLSSKNFILEELFGRGNKYTNSDIRWNVLYLEIGSPLEVVPFCSLHIKGHCFKNSPPTPRKLNVAKYCCYPWWL